jgi:hypothetical protein
MNLCDDGHDEVCYEAKKCPACELIEELNKTEDIVASKDEEIDELNQALDALKGEEDD